VPDVLVARTGIDGYARQDHASACPPSAPAVSPLAMGGPKGHALTTAEGRDVKGELLESTKPLEKRIRSKLKKHLASLGFSTADDGSLSLVCDTKDAIRAVHSAQRIERLQENDRFIAKSAEGVLSAFADGNQLCPAGILPRLQLVAAGTWESDVFRLASLLWSVPVSRGYGRRLRFLVWDASNGKLMGIFALGDPSFNLAARDNLIGWSSADRKERLVHMMDAFILGAVPPYTKLLGTKVIATLVRSQEVVSTFRQRYRGTAGLISRRQKQPTLVAITTSSALGRSSAYNRLRLEGIDYFKSIGYTGGWGHFHVPRDLFEDMRDFLALRKHPYARGYEFGDGPNWRLRTIRVALDLLGYNADLLRHGVNREVFVSWVAQNGLRILRGEIRRPSYPDLLPATVVGCLARDRWMIPRAEREPSYLDWKRSDVLGQVDWRSLVAESRGHVAEG
jgi:hypothetical protein